MTSQSQTGLRRRIEETIGKQILEKYCQEGDETSGPQMMPPIPDSTFIDKLPEEGVLEGQTAADKELQDGYEAEIKVFRSFEDLKRKVIVLHQLVYTHEQYSVFLPSHQCYQKKCKKGPEVHPCHQTKGNIDGETDFVVIGDNFVAVFEVKGLTVSKDETCCSELISKCSVRRNEIPSSVQNTNAVKFEGCCSDAVRQRKRMIDLIKAIDPLVMVYEFTVFPNISTEEVDEGYRSSDTTLLFSEHLNKFTEWFDTNIPSPVTDESVDKVMKTVQRCFLGLWCINKENKWDLNICSLSKCIKDTDDKLNRALVTRKSVDEAKQNECSRKRKGKERKYPENAEMVEAPALFRRCFSNSKELSVNLRNTFEISAVLSVIREHNKQIDYAGTGSVKLPQQKRGHYLRGTKPVIYLLRDDEPATWEDILNKELEKLRGSDSCLEDKDIAVLLNVADSEHRKHTLDTVNSVLERCNTTDDKITVRGTGACLSAEWPAVIYIYSYRSGSGTVTLPDNSEKEITLSYTIPALYVALSRARVYTTVIIFNYTPNTCEYTDKLLKELRQRRDVCRIIDIEQSDDTS